MKYASLLLGLSGALLLVACGGSSDAGAGGGNLTAAQAAGFLGIYQTTSYTENSASCASPGASILATAKDGFFVIMNYEFLGLNNAMLISCANVGDCQDKRAKQLANQGYIVNYTYTLSSATNASTLGGFEATTGSDFNNNKTCTGRTYADVVLTKAADHSVHLEARTKKLADKPETSDGFCEVFPAQSAQEAASVPCSDLKVLDGTFLQAM